MPEFGEIRIYRDFINSSNEEVTEIKTPPGVKGGEVIPSLKINGTLSALSRGKELAITFYPKNKKEFTIKYNMGLSGYWGLADKQTEKLYPQFTKHSVFEIHLKSGKWLALSDTLKYAKWKVIPFGQPIWGKDRSPDPLDQRTAFETNITSNLNKAAFSKPAYEALLNQKYFGGVGNYLRAILCYRLGGDWSLPMVDYIELHKDEFFIELNSLLIESYSSQLPGSSLPPDFYYPYQEGKFILDKNKRKFWYHE